MYEFIYGRNRLDKMDNWIFYFESQFESKLSKNFLLSAFQDDVMLVNDAYKVLSAIIATRVGREAFIASRGMTVLSLLNIRQGFQVKYKIFTLVKSRIFTHDQIFQDEEALELLLDLLTYERDSCWSYYSGLQVRDIWFSTPTLFYNN